MERGPVTGMTWKLLETAAPRGGARFSSDPMSPRRVSEDEITS